MKSPSEFKYSINKYTTHPGGPECFPSSNKPMLGVGVLNWFVGSGVLEQRNQQTRGGKSTQLLSVMLLHVLCYTFFIHSKIKNSVSPTHGPYFCVIDPDKDKGKEKNR